MKKGEIAAKLLTVVAGCLLLAVVVEALASTPLFLNRHTLRRFQMSYRAQSSGAPLFLNRIDLSTWGHRSTIPLAGGSAVGGVYPAHLRPLITNNVPVYLSTNRSRSPETLRVLFVGNGLTAANNMADVINAMAIGGKFKIEADVRAYEGYSLRSHVGDLRTYQAITNVVFDRNNFTNALPLDAVIMQEHTVLPVYDFPQMQTNVSMLTQVITNQDSLPMLFMTWSRPDPFFTRADVLFRTDSAYTALGQQQNMPVVPCGRAWELSEWRRPEVVLRENDGYTPTIKGTYLNACMFYAYLTWQSPVGLNNGGLHAIPQDEITFLQNIAWEIFLWRKDGLKFWQ
ncbi:MAG: hypothetical protein QF685_11240 [Verrucomicrobiota bacterium]|jgi:hypothetical protein|nr:hypothetical protein [Verrucomicrobiota bacterium]